MRDCGCSSAVHSRGAWLRMHGVARLSPCRFCADDVQLCPLLLFCVCVLSIGRHSDSLDTSLMRCGRCQGALVRLGRFNADGTPAKERAPTAFALFVQQQYSCTKAANPNTPHRDIMKLLSSGYKDSKGAATTGGAGSSSGNGDECQSVSAAQAELEAQMTALSVAEEECDVVDQEAGEYY